MQVEQVKSYKKEIIELNCKILTPLHIGSGNVLNKGIDFFIDNNQAGIIDIHKIYNKIGESKIQWWTDKIKSGEDIWYELRDKYKCSLDDISKEILPLKTSSYKNQIREFLRNQYTSNPIIPGSSIKGAIRTAVFTHKILQDKSKLEAFKEKINEAHNKLSNNRKINDLRKDLEHHTNRIVDDIFQNKNINGEGAQNDVFRFIQISDVELDKNNLFVAELNTLNWKGVSKDEGNWKIDNRLSILLQVIQGEFKLTMKIDERFYKYNSFGISNINDLLKIINNHFHELSELEKDNFENDSESGFLSDNLYNDILNCYKNLLNCKYLLRVGFASGWDFMTGAWAKKLDDEIWNNLKIFLVKSPGYEKFFFPKTRRLVKVDNKYHVPGYIELSYQN
ncbi:MAG: type III-A CRISPR-associated RAMP protein Csm5 [Bacteroidia bacterium]|nr:MAG: type III-A CRISPR-associated RAMP protein Csm5 [Bacteroidia bacterium]